MFLRDLRILFEALPDQLIEFFPGRAAFDAVDDFASERVNQHSARCIEADTASSKIKDRLFIQLSDRGAVSALDVVGVNLQLRFRIDPGAV